MPAILLVAACSPINSGIEGRITAGPACPVMQADVPCPDQPYAGSLSILAQDGRKAVATVTADATGYYRVAVRPGTYIIHPESPGVLPSGEDIVVVVQSNQYTHQDIVYDTGIR